MTTNGDNDGNEDDRADERKFRDALAFVDCVFTLNKTAPDALERVPLPPRVAAIHSKFGVPPRLRAFLERNCYKGTLFIGQARFHRVDKLLREGERYAAVCTYETICLNDGLLPVGSGPNGDLIVVDLRSGLTGFVAMAELYKAAEAAEAGELDEPARSVLALSPFRIGAFFLAAGQHAYDLTIFERFFPTCSRNIGEQHHWSRFVADPGTPLRAAEARASTPLAPATAAFFASRGVGPELRAFLSAHCYPADLDFAGYRLYPVNELPARQARISGSFVAVGAVYNRSFDSYQYNEIVVDVRSGRAGLVEHSSPSGSALSPYDLPTFLHLAEKYSPQTGIIGEPFPVDYYSASGCDWTPFGKPPTVPLTRMGAFPPEDAPATPSPPEREPPPQPLHPLEAALVEAPDELPRYRAWAAHLRTAGDPRGELIELQVALFEARRAHILRLLDERGWGWLGERAEELDVRPEELLGSRAMDLMFVLSSVRAPEMEAEWTRSEAIIERHRFAWLGVTGAAQLRWKLGYVHSVKIQDEVESALATWRHVAAQPVGRLVRGLSFAVSSHPQLIDGLVETPLPAPVSQLRLLALGASPRGTLALEPLYPQVPHLRALFISLQDRLELGRLQLPAMRNLHFVGSGLGIAELAPTNVRVIARADWPSLQRLVLDLRARGSHERTTVDDLAPLWRDERAPGLIALGLQNAPCANALPAELARSPLLPHLKLLDLSTLLGARDGLTDAGAEALLAHAPAFAHLDHLNLSGACISARLEPKLRRLCRSVNLSSFVSGLGDLGGLLGGA
jgi:hypothetical protein